MNLSEIKETIQLNNRVLIELFLPGCAPCKQMKEVILPQLQDITVLYFDCSKDQDSFNFFVEQSKKEIVGVPCLLLFENGSFSKRLDGYSNLEKVKQFIEHDIHDDFLG